MKTCFLIVFVAFTNLIWAHEADSKAQLRVDSLKSDFAQLSLPITHAVSLSANFAELRQNHFHGGLDFRTNGEVGKPLVAVADGYVSRIRVMPNGYGLAIYLKLDCGYSCVYGHCLKFARQIDEYVREYQYREQSNNVDIELPENALRVHKNQLIAYSGNTGSSMGPHLHFELRDSSANILFNPLIAYDVIDNVRPQIFNAFVYQLDSSGCAVQSLAPTICKAVAKSVGTYSGQTSKCFSGKIGFGIQGQDRMTATHNVFGYYSVKMFIDNELYYFHQLDCIDLNESRYINSLGDFDHFVKTHNWIQKTFVEPNNQLHIYKYVKNNGVFDCRTAVGDKITIRFEVSDYAGNVATMEMPLNISHDEPALPATEFTQMFEWQKPNTFESEGVRLDVPENALYTNVGFRFSRDTARQSTALKADVYQIDYETTPLHYPARLVLPADTIAPDLVAKAVMVKISGKRLIAVEGSAYSDNKMYGTISTFGKYSVAIDTIAPSVRALGKYSGANLTYTNKLSFSISDNLSGLGTYNAYIDNQWAIVYFDQKSARLTLTFDNKRLKPKSQHEFRLVVEDKIGNATELKFKFYK